MTSRRQIYELYKTCKTWACERDDYGHDDDDDDDGDNGYAHSDHNLMMQHSQFCT